MRFLLIVALAAAGYGGYQWWQQRGGDMDGTGGAQATASANGFVPVLMPNGVPRNVVLILAPPNCPSDQAQRSEALVAELERSGIPVRRGSGFSFDLEAPTAEQRAGVDRAIQVFKRGAPAVYVNGMAMSNPSPAQAIAEYQRTRR